MPSFSGVVAIPSSLTAAALATAVGLDPATVQKMEVVIGTAPDAAHDPTLVTSEITTPTSFVDNLPAVFYDFAGTATFRRPLRVSDNGTGNALDTVQHTGSIWC